jgi:hypothetical protein
MRKSWIIAVILASCMLFMALKLKIDGIPRTKVPGSSILYLPSGKNLQYASFGNRTLMADLIYIWAIQYYSNYKIADRFAYLEHIFSIIAELDPLYVDPYEVGAVIAVYEARDVELAFKILDLGLKNNPDQWLFPFIAGHFAQMFLKDFEIARKYYKITMGIEGAPSQTARLYANAAYMVEDYQAAWQNWLEIYQTADDERIKKIASNHLYRVRATLDIQKIEEALNKYRERHGRWPDDLERLVGDDLLGSLPQDLDGKDYVYDPQTGKVEAPTIPWKR